MCVWETELQSNCLKYETTKEPAGVCASRESPRELHCSNAVVCVVPQKHSGIRIQAEAVLVVTRSRGNFEVHKRSLERAPRRSLKIGGFTHSTVVYIPVPGIPY